MSLCLTCSSSLPDSPLLYRTPCCSKPICEGCLARNPRLREYDPCLRCGDLRTSDGVQRVRRGREAVQTDRARAENVFEIGDEDDEGEDFNEDGRSVGDATQRGPPPAYDDDDREGRSGGGDGVGHDERSARNDLDARPSHSSSRPASTRDSARSQSGSRRSARSSLDGDGRRQDLADAGVNDANDDPLEVVEVRHPVSRSDTLLAIARKYAADPHDLLTLNSLPPSTLTSQPHLLRTRKTLLISRRSIPRSKLPPSTLFTSDDGVDGIDDIPLTDAEIAEQAKRERERAIKRFQLLTKSQDPSVGEAYLALSEFDEGSVDFLSGLEVDQEADRQRKAGAEGKEGEEGKEGKEGKGVGGKSKREWPDQGNREQRALDQFYEDERWEREVGGPRERVEGGWRRVGDGRKMGIKV